LKLILNISSIESFWQSKLCSKITIRPIREKLFLYIISDYMNLNFNKKKVDKLSLKINSEYFIIFLFLYVLFKNNKKNNFSLIAPIVILLQNFTLPFFSNLEYILMVNYLMNLCLFVKLYFLILTDHDS
jgi:hypothetical protein